MKFAFYYCFVLDEWCRKNITTSSFASVDMNGFKRFPIPIPPLAEQERIVAILNKFDTLVNDISVGLPAEINARRKQYEYYRNKLLTFKKFPSSGKKFNSPPLEGCQSETDGVVR
jgi:type I restriction enzyme S subunit